MSEVLYRKLDAVFRASTDRYEIYIGARTRHDGRWEGFLEFRPLGGGAAIGTNVQTTQATAQDVFAWAAGLSDAHFERPRYLVRYTAGGTDWLELTLDGANALGAGQLASRVATDSDRLVLDVP